MHYIHETQTFEDFEFFFYDINQNSPLTSCYTMGSKNFKMAFQVDFYAKNVQRFIFGLLVAPKLKKQTWGHNGPPQVTMSFQSTGKIVLI